MQFADQSQQWEYTVPSMPDQTYGQADTDDATLDNFFGRPIKIAQYTWSPGVTLFETFNPWTQFFENPRVINRIANYNLLRAKLRVRVVLNGNGFYYGRAICSYTPLHTFDEMTVDRAYFIQDVVAASQRPHIYIDPTNSQGGDLTLPFFWPQNALSIPDADWRNMGDMHIHQLQSLKHANGSTDPITVTVFAWAEDVHFSIPTQNDPVGLVPQAGDEYGNGVVSRPAAIVAKAAGKLAKIPVIGVYARATELAAGAVAGVAKLFGYSRPVMNLTPTPFVPHLIGNLANTSVPDQSTKLAFDLKQELTIDPRTMGLSDTDEMAIRNVSTRESYLTSFDWTIAANVGMLLWNTEITPVTWAELNDEIHLPACAFAALPFRYWRGTMKYRFQIVASSFHKGRLQLSFDPRLTGIGEFNTQYVYVIDLAKERDFTVEIGWGHESGALLHKRPGSQTVPYSVFPFPIPTIENRNGIMSVRVLNELTSPNSTVNNDVQVNVFVSTGDDFEVFVPDAALLDSYTLFDTAAPAAALASPTEERENAYGSVKIPLDSEPEPLDPPLKVIYEPQSGESPMQQADADLTTDENAPMKSEASAQMAPTPSHEDCFSHVYFGDPVTSFRQVLKRYQFHSALTKPTPTNAWVTMTAPDFPAFRGYDPNGMNFTTDGDPYNYTKNVLLNYVTSAYTGRRGGLRWKYQRSGASDARLAGVNHHLLTRVSDGGTYGISERIYANHTGNTSDQRVRVAMIETPSCWDGTVANQNPENGILEAEFPYFLNRRFSPAKRLNVNQNTDLYDKYHKYSTCWMTTGTAADVVMRYISVGEDFNLVFYTGPPRLYYLDPSQDPPPLTP